MKILNQWNPTEMKKMQLCESIGLIVDTYAEEIYGAWGKVIRG